MESFQSADHVLFPVPALGSSYTWNCGFVESSQPHREAGYHLCFTDEAQRGEVALCIDGKR